MATTRKTKPEEPKAAETKQPEQSWDLGSWCGHTQFKCRECPYDTLSEDAIKKHVEAHEAAKWRPLVASPLVGPDGKPMPAAHQPGDEATKQEPEAPATPEPQQPEPAGQPEPKAEE